MSEVNEYNILFFDFKLKNKIQSAHSLDFNLELEQLPWKFKFILCKQQAH